MHNEDPKHVQSRAFRGESQRCARSLSGHAECIGIFYFEVADLSFIRQSARSDVFSLTPNFDLVIVSTSGKQSSSGMDSNGPYRPWETFSCDSRSCTVGAHLHALQIYLPRPPSGNSKVAHFHYAKQPPIMVESDGTRVLWFNIKDSVRFQYHRISAPFTRVLLDSNLVSITDILGSPGRGNCTDSSCSA